MSFFLGPYKRQHHCYGSKSVPLKTLLVNKKKVLSLGLVCDPNHHVEEETKPCPCRNRIEKTPGKKTGKSWFYHVLPRKIVLFSVVFFLETRKNKVFPRKNMVLPKKIIFQPKKIVVFT